MKPRVSSSQNNERATPPTTALDWAATPGVATGILQELAQRRRRRSRRRAALAAACAAVIAVAAIVKLRSPVVPSATPHAASTAQLEVPERRVLPDGSVVELKNGAEIAVTYSESARRITLSQGEAHFEVARNASRPFVVTAGGVDVRAVGTAFSVGLVSSSVQVLVTHGEVAVEKGAASMPDQPQPPQPTLLASLTAGNRVVVAIAGTAAAESPPSVEKVTPSETAELLAWRVPRLDFSGTPLSEAIPIFNEHSAVQIKLGDPALGSLQLSGIIRADNVESLLRLLEANYGIAADRSDTHVVLRRPN